ncbi:hypothetical protein OHA33_33085 [Streptomyces sp. NBC_00562]|uniref:hypothetical protein n=1 Tax=Streptomyces sp. NBC_00562 TaxID=2975777 RepID=UPI002E8203AC|nr:hypothetical protein [Streptomyces sp. NBC_00562]WUC23302.1 hypothetical protein OHA33_33085 [Streptomyces sp. NBC_00562]
MTTVHTDTGTLTSDIPDELQDAFDDFLDDRVVETTFERTTHVNVLRSAFFHYCVTVARCAPPTGAQLKELFNAAGYSMERQYTTADTYALIVRGLRIDTSVPRGGRA